MFKDLPFWSRFFRSNSSCRSLNLSIYCIISFLKKTKQIYVLNLTCQACNQSSIYSESDEFSGYYMNSFKLNPITT